MASNRLIEGTLTNSDFILDTVEQTPIFADEFALDITGAVGQNLTISLIDTDESFDPFLEVLDPITGEVIASDDNSGGDNNAEISDDDNLIVPNDGRLIIRVTNALDNPELEDENPYSLNFSLPEDNIDIDVQPKNIIVFGPLGGTSAQGDASVTLDGQLLSIEDFNFNRNGFRTRVDEYQLEASVGEDITIALNSSDTDAFNPFLQVINADTGEVVAENDDRDNNDLNSLIAPGQDDTNGIPGELRIEDDLDYIIRVTSSDNFPQTDESVDYTLEVSLTEGGQVTISPRIALIAEEALELTGETAQIAYVAYYGRPADPGGLDFWTDVLTENEVSYSPRNGDNLTGAEQEIYNRIINDFGRSDESDRLFEDIDSNRERINQIYQFCFDRDGDEGGLDFWTNQLDLGNVTLATLALEVALGAQNEDIEVLNNKIDSADLFSNSIDTDEERDAYVGSSAELFGREWLADFDDTVSTQGEVDSALDDLVDGL